MKGTQMGRKSLMAAALVMSLGLAGCDDLLSVELLGATEADKLDSPKYAALLVVSAEGDFECAYDKAVYNSSQLSGEMLGIAVGATTIWLTKRDVQSNHTDYSTNECSSTGGLYVPLQHARFMAEDTHRRLLAWSDADVPNRTRHLGRTAMYAAFTYGVFGDLFCSVAVDLGPELSRNQTYQLARDRFTTAIQYATQANDTETLMTSYVGRARYALRMGDKTAALADAQKVVPVLTAASVGFRKNASRGTANNRRQNSIYSQNVFGTQVTVDPAYWTTTFAGVPDRRVSVLSANRLGTDTRTPLYRAQKYLSYDAPIRLASAVEAALIIAEIQGGQTAVNTINNLHALAGVPAYAGGTEAEIQAQIIEERRREFFLEGLRMGDLRTYNGGAEFKKWNRAGTQNPYTFLQFGGTECFPFPDVERNGNPNFQG